MITSDEDNRTVYCGNLSEEATDDILYELFFQAGPIERIRRPRDDNGKSKPFAFIIYKYESAVPYALEIFSNTKLFGRTLRLNSRSILPHIPVLDTHLSDSTDQSVIAVNGLEHSRERSHRSENRRSNRDRSNEPQSWAEYNALRDHSPQDLQVSSERERQSNSNSSYGNPPAIPDFNALLQMGHQMMLPGVMGGFHGMMPIPPVGMFGMFSGLSGNMYPSMQGTYSGNEGPSSERSRGRTDAHEGRNIRKDHHEERGSRREHPYNERRDDHRHHDRGYSSSRSSHDRERRNRRSH